MRNPPRTQQNSIFEPLFSHDEEEELIRTPPTHLIHSSSSEWLISSTYSASPCVDKAYCNNQLRKAPTCTIFNEEMSTNIQRKCAELVSQPECEPVISCDHGKPSSSSTDVLSARSILQSASAPSRSLSSGNIDKDDDGSVASKLLASITKSLSSPSLLSCCKESARETSYQKTLKLRMMKLQHCAEELGSESSDGALKYSNGGVNSTFDSFSTMSSFESSSRLLTASSFARPLPNSPIPQNDEKGKCDASPMMISVRSSPNLRCPSLVSRHTSHVRERSFPPPLTHALTRSASADSFTLSLRAHREDGRFMLKEVKVPSRQYLQANRKGGRLTLQLFTPAEKDIEQEIYVHEELEDAMDVQPDDSVAGMCEGGLISAASDKGDMVGCSYSDKPALESATIVDVEGDAGVIERKEGKEMNDDVNMVETEEKISKEANSDVRKDGGLSEESLLMAAINVDDDGKAYDVSHFGASGMKRPGFNGTECEPEKWLLASTSRSDLNTPLLGDIPRLKVLSPLIRLAQDEENMVLQSRLNRKTFDIKGRKSMLAGLEISTTTNLQGAGFDIDRSLSSTIIFKDVDTSSLMENVTKLVNSFGLDGGKWCQRKLKSRDQLERSGFKSGQLKDISVGYNGITSINIGVRKVDKRGPHKANHGVNKKVDTHEAIGVHILNVECGSEPPCTDAFAKEGGGIMDMNARGLSTTNPTTLHFDVLLPLHLDWLHNLHCKELSQRSHFANKGFPYVAIRS